jgi:quinone-modifying oxidoreductase subunit QmoA
MAEVTKVAGQAVDYDVTIDLQAPLVEPGACDLSKRPRPFPRMCERVRAGLGHTQGPVHGCAFAFHEPLRPGQGQLFQGRTGRPGQADIVNLGDAPGRSRSGPQIIYAPVEALRRHQADKLGAGSIKNCVSNMQLERLASPAARPTERSCGLDDAPALHRLRAVRRVPGREHLNYCSYILLMASSSRPLRREQYPNARGGHILHRLRTPARYDNFARRSWPRQADRGQGQGRGRGEEPAAGTSATVEDAVTGIKSGKRFEMAVLARACSRAWRAELPVDVALDGWDSSWAARKKAFSRRLRQDAARCHEIGPIRDRRGHESDSNGEREVEGDGRKNRCVYR